MLVLEALVAVEMVEQQVVWDKHPQLGQQILVAEVELLVIITVGEIMLVKLAALE
jgi:hypothetical protein